MKKYLVIGNPINHSLSPQLHNHWIKKNNIDANYEKQILNAEDLKSVIFKIKENEIKFSTIAQHDFLKPGNKINLIDILFKKIEKKND